MLHASYDYSEFHPISLLRVRTLVSLLLSVPRGLSARRGIHASAAPGDLAWQPHNPQSIVRRFDSLASSMTGSAAAGGVLLAHVPKSLRQSS